MPLIAAANLRFSYRSEEPVLRDVSLTIEAGEMVAIIGESGSGKSTLFYLLGALTDRYQGDITFSGVNLKELTTEEKAQLRNQGIGFVFQQFFLLPRATVLENILLPAHYPFATSQPQPSDISRATELASRLGIRDLLERRPEELSGGQQQRVAIARALLRDPQLILADEPTGNLDSETTKVVLEIFKDLNRQGRTVVIITHSPEVAEQCSRIIRLRDGRVIADSKSDATPQGSDKSLNVWRPDRRHQSPWLVYLRNFKPALANINRGKTKSALTMLGVILGITAVLSTMSLGRFAKDRILASYEAVGVNNLSLSGYPNWRRRSSDYSPAVFRAFDWVKDILPMTEIFSSIEMVSPFLNAYVATFNLSGLSYSDDRSSVLGVSEEFFAITNQSLDSGRLFSAVDVAQAHPVCVIGAKVATDLGPFEMPIGKIITVVNDDLGSEFPCKVIGILESEPAESGLFSPDHSVFLPYTYFQRVSTNPWMKEIRDLRMKIRMETDPDAIGEQLEGYFTSRYGTSGQFSASSNAKAVAQMRLFLNVFSLLLTAVAVIALAVGGIGINNMMLVNLSERLNEIGLRKALGASSHHIRSLVLTESLLLAMVGGGLGLAGGFVAYHLLIYLSSLIIPNTQFAWVVEPTAVLISLVAMMLTGVLSGLVPALKADGMQVIDALRRE